MKRRSTRWVKMRLARRKKGGRERVDGRRGVRGGKVGEACIRSREAGCGGIEVWVTNRLD